MQLEGLSALVTGGASGLGLATTRRLVSAGARVVLVDLPQSEGKTIEEQSGGAVRFVAADITDEAEMSNAIDVSAEHGPLRAVVHCAGRGGDRARIVDKQHRPGPLDSYAEVLRVNLVGTYNVLRLAAARMSDNDVVDGDRGAIVLTASVAAFEGQIGQIAYASSKAGVHGLTIAAARDLASWQIRVNTIAPGVIDTAMLGRLRDDVRASLAASVPHPARLGQPEDYAHLAVSLLENSYINGETVRLDGALRMAPR
jgi:NAD(P)-dependent dehydrogenase (short-subunit alcohol dehydrogenase family)